MTYQHSDGETKRGAGPPVSAASEFVDTAPDTAPDTARSQRRKVGQAGGALARQIKRPVRVAEILGVVSGYFGVTLAEMTGPDRRRRIVTARHVAAWCLRRSGFSFVDIGLALNRDHTTIMASVRRVDAERVADPGVCAALDRMVRT